VSILLQLLNGLTTGAIYILLASGLTIVFGLQRIVNAAHGVFYMLGAYLAIDLAGRLGFPLTLAVAFAASAVLGLVLERTAIRPLIRWRRDPTHVLILTLGVAIAASEVTKLVWGPVPRLADVPRALAGSVRIAGLIYPAYWLFVMAFTTVLMVAIAIVFHKTTLGALVRSIALNREISEALGTNAPDVSSKVFALGAGLAGLAGALAAPILLVTPTMCFDLLMVLFVIVILGGLGSLLGVVASGVLVGVVNSFGVAYLTGTAGTIFVFAVMIVALIVRPQGLFGREGLD
jgi:branched-chain amino acid transport system permease protein